MKVEWDGEVVKVATFRHGTGLRHVITIQMTANSWSAWHIREFRVPNHIPVGTKLRLILTDIEQLCEVGSPTVLQQAEAANLETGGGLLPESETP